MKKYLMMMMTLLITIPMFSQDDFPSKTKPSKEERLKKYESLKVAHITNELDLTPEQAQKFWPIYNKYDSRKKEAREEMRKKGFSEMTEKEAEMYLQKSHQKRQDAIDLDFQMLEELKGVLSAKQRVMLLKSENKFHRTLVKRYAKNHKKGKKDRLFEKKDRLFEKD